MTVTPGAHLSKAQVDALGAELDALYDEVRADLGEARRQYIRKVVDAQHKLELGGRLRGSPRSAAVLAGERDDASTRRSSPTWRSATNVMHGQWDWMRDPSLHSTTFEWDTVPRPTAGSTTHNYLHHTYTNVIGKDRDLGYTIMRVSGDQDWKPFYLAQPFYNVALALTFEYAIALYDLEFEKLMDGSLSVREYAGRFMEMSQKMATQGLKDYVVCRCSPASRRPTTLAANFTANIIRNVWAHTIIFCGHFPDGAARSRRTRTHPGETRGEWYLRQMEGSCNISGGELLHLMSGNLSFQIEHHIYPDLPSNRYKEISPRVQEILRALRDRLHHRPAVEAVRAGAPPHHALRLPGGAKSEEREVDPARNVAAQPAHARDRRCRDRRKAAACARPACGQPRSRSRRPPRGWSRRCRRRRHPPSSGVPERGAHCGRMRRLPREFRGRCGASAATLGELNRRPARPCAESGGGRRSRGNPAVVAQDPG